MTHAKQVWFWSGSHYRYGILAGSIVIDAESGEIWYVDEIEAIAGTQEPVIPFESWTALETHTVI